MASHPNTALCEKYTHRVHKKQWSECLMGMYSGSGFEDCVAGGHMSWLKKCFEDNYI